MSNTRTEGFHITPLTLIVCGALWAVVVALMSWNLSMTVELVRNLNGVPTRLADHEQRLRNLEAMR
jgi:hypothetical protein